MHLREVGIERVAQPPDAGTWRALLERISGAYADSDRDRARDHLRPVPPIEAPPNADAPPRIARDERVLDMATLDSIRGLGPPGGPDPVQELCEMYLDDVSARVASAQRAALTGDSAEIARQAHAIKGAAGNFGAMRMYVVARVLQEIADTERAGAAVAELDAELARLREVVEREILRR